jgi:hypothetical protein
MLMDRKPASVAVIQEALCRTGLERTCSMTLYTKYLAIFLITVCSIYEQVNLWPEVK